MSNPFLLSPLAKTIILLILFSFLQNIKTISFHKSALHDTQVRDIYQHKYMHKYQINLHNQFFLAHQIKQHEQALAKYYLQQLPDKFIQGQYNYVQMQIIQKLGLIQLVMKIQQPGFSLYYEFVEIVNASKKTTQTRIRIKMPKEGKYIYTIFIREAESRKIIGKGTQGQFQTINLNKANLNINKAFQNKVPTQMNMSVIANKLTLQWNDFCQIAKLSFTQKHISKTIYVTNSWGTIEVPYTQFQNFQEGDTSLSISCAQTSNLSLFNINSSFVQVKQIINFKAGYHKYQHIDLLNIQVNMYKLKWKVDLNKQYQIKGKILTELNGNNQYVLQLPKSNLTARATRPQDYFKTGIIQKRGQNFQIKLKNQIKQPGIYILQILNNRLKEILNFPIYVGDFYPLLPDFQDSKPNSKIKGQSNSNFVGSIKDQQNKLLQMVNNERLKWGVCPLQQNKDLSAIGEQYANLMANLQQAGHDVSKNIQQRIYEYFGKKIVPLGQNVVTEESLVDAHFKLCRSPSHLINIISPNFTQVGFGISLDESTQILYVVEQFKGDNKEINGGKCTNNLNPI